MSEKIAKRSHEEFINSLRILQPSKKLYVRRVMTM